MNDLVGKRILLVEDDYMIAQDACAMLADAGVEVVGPLPGVAEALDALENQGPLDAAVLDVNLNGEMVFPIADALGKRGVPFIFLTGYDTWALPQRYAAHPTLQKPLGLQSLSKSVAPLLGLAA